VKLSSWPEIGSDGEVLLTPYVPKGITGYDDDDDVVRPIMKAVSPRIKSKSLVPYKQIFQLMRI